MRGPLSLCQLKQAVSRGIFYEALLHVYAHKPDPSTTSGLHTPSGHPAKVDVARVFTLDELLDRLPLLHAWQHRHQSYELGLFLRWLDLAQIDNDPARVARLTQGLASFDELPWIFQEGTELYINASPPWAGRLASIELFKGGFGPPSWQPTIEVVASLNGLPTICTTTTTLSYFSDIRPASSLPVSLITAAQKATLAARGQQFRAFVSGTHYVAYQGVITQPGFFGSIVRPASGRLMLDGTTLATQSPGLARSISARFEATTEDDDHGHRPAKSQGLAASVKDADFWRCWPSLPAFSFRAKAWGEVDIEHITPIKFRSDAFDRLVLDPSLKTTVKALVEHSGSAFTDLIDDKSGGLIFLLEGPPGCGKTLTAEAVAEVLQRPLYSISIGELGTAPSELEDALRGIFRYGYALERRYSTRRSGHFLRAARRLRYCPQRHGRRFPASA